MLCPAFYHNCYCCCCCLHQHFSVLHVFTIIIWIYQIVLFMTTIYCISPSSHQRSSRPEVFYKKCILKNITKFTGVLSDGCVWHSTMVIISFISTDTVSGGCMKKGVLRNFAKFTRKHLCQSPFLIKLKRDSCTGVFL